MKLRRFFYLLFAALIVVAGYSFVKLNQKASIVKEQLINIPKNTTIGNVIGIFNEQGLLKPPWFFKNAVKIYSRFTGEGIYAGSYMFEKGNTNFEILYSIFTGKQLCTVKVTFPEGIRLQKYASILTHKLSIDSAGFMQYVMSDSLLKANSIPEESVEGYFMPNTYEFYWKEPIREIVSRLMDAQNQVWRTKFERNAEEEGRTRYEILTLASIIEAETPVDDEKARISGVYYNRLKYSMPLQSDPTVQFALGNHKSRILFKDLDIESPYNTYKHLGLPPGPINSPGIKSIGAALFPENNNYLYFVAIGDGSGRHSFARTAAQHSYNVQAYRKNLRER
jgi:UPF0755 protein